MAKKRKKKAPPQNRKKKLSLRLVLELCMGLALIALAVLLLTGRSIKGANRDGEVTLRLHGVDATEELSLATGALWVPEDAPLEGYTFLRWQDEGGNAVPAEGLRVWEDGDYYPVYAMQLGAGAHAPYLPLDEKGAFHPAGTVTRREVVCILYGLLDTELVGDGVFLDLPEDDEAYRAAATLKTLGVLTGSRLHPDETVTRREFLAMLCAFFPEGTEAAVFADLTEEDPDYRLFCTAAERGWIESGPETSARPDDQLTRMELVCMLSCATDRHGDAQRRHEMVGTILDVAQDDPHFWDVAEAALPHRHVGTGAEERWTWSKSLPLRDEGLFFLGVELHAIDENGNPVINGEYAGLRFDANGIETSGDPELDEMIRELLATLVDPETMEPEEMLHLLHHHVSRGYGYRRGNYYPPGEPSGWEAAEAKTLLTDKRGNCYNYAALLYELARAIGYDARAYTGSVRGRSEVTAIDVYGNNVYVPRGCTPHGWVEIEFDGEWLILDPEFELEYVQHGKLREFYKMGATERKIFGYNTETSDIPVLAPSPTPTATPEPSPDPASVTPTPEASPEPTAPSPEPATPAPTAPPEEPAEP